MKERCLLQLIKLLNFLHLKYGNKTDQIFFSWHIKSKEVTKNDLNKETGLWQAAKLHQWSLETLNKILIKKLTIPICCTVGRAACNLLIIAARLISSICFCWLAWAANAAACYKFMWFFTIKNIYHSMYTN